MCIENITGLCAGCGGFAMLDIFVNWFVIAIPFLVTVGATVLTLKLPHERHYRKFVICAIVTGLAFSGITYWQQVRAARQAVNDRDKAISDTADRVAKKTTENVTDAMGKQYGAIITEMTTQNGNLRAQLTEQGKKEDTISGSNIVTGKRPIRVELANGSLPAGDVPLEIHAAGMQGTTSLLQYGKYARQLILTTNRVMVNGAHASIICEHKINHGTVWIAGS
jgi:hypothetical protein